MLLQIKIICTTLHIVPLVRIVGANTTLIQPITPKLKNLGQVFQKTLFKLYIFESELEKCLHGKAQIANKSFNGTIWDVFQKILLLHYPI